HHRLTLFPYTTLFRSSHHGGGVIQRRIQSPHHGDVSIAIEILRAVFVCGAITIFIDHAHRADVAVIHRPAVALNRTRSTIPRRRSEEHTSELQSRSDL